MCLHYIVMYSIDKNRNRITASDDTINFILKIKRYMFRHTKFIISVVQNILIEYSSIAKNEISFFLL